MLLYWKNIIKSGRRERTRITRQGLDYKIHSTVPMISLLGRHRVRGVDRLKCVERASSPISPNEDSRILCVEWTGNLMENMT